MAETTASTVPRAGSWEWGAAPGELERMRRKERVVMLGWGWGGWWCAMGMFGMASWWNAAICLAKTPAAHCVGFAPTPGSPKMVPCCIIRQRKLGSLAMAGEREWADGGWVVLSVGCPQCCSAAHRAWDSLVAVSLSHCQWQWDGARAGALAGSLSNSSVSSLLWPFCR